TNRATPTTLIPIRRAVPERDLDGRSLCPSCRCCTATPIAPQGGPGGRTGHVEVPALATRLTRGAPWFCVPSSQRVCLCVLRARPPSGEPVLTIVRMVPDKRN